MSADMTDPNRVAAHLLQYIANEVQGCAKFISMAMAEYAATGNLPPSMFEEAAPASKRQKRKVKGPKRKPTAFNMFVSEKMAQIRNGASDEDEVVATGTSIFSRAVSEWKKLSDEDKKAYSEKYKAEVGDEEAAADMNGDEDVDEHAGNDEEEGEEEEEPEDAPEEEAPAAKEEEPEEEEEKPQKQPAQPAVSPQPVVAQKQEKKRKNADAEEPKSKKEKAGAAPPDEPKSEKKKKKKDKNGKKKDKQES